MSSNDKPPTEGEFRSPLVPGDAEFAKALEMPETGARYQQHDRSVDLLRLAKAIHEDYCETARGYGDTPETNSALVAWEDLPPTLQSANLAQADDIPCKLRSLGYEIAEAGGVPAAGIVLDPALVEPLSRLEHDRWMAEKLRAGWVYAPVRDNARFHHPQLVPYDDLSEREKEKDRDTVRNIPKLLAKANCLVKAI